MNLLPAWPRHSINWNASLYGKVMHSTAGMVPEGGKQGKGFFVPTQRRQIRSAISNAVRRHHYPLKRFVCAHSKRTNCAHVSGAFKCALAQNEACWSLSGRLIEIGGAASKFSAIQSRSFDQMDVETDCCWVLALFPSLCGFLISFST